MAALNSCEILDELKKLGIDIPSDMIKYLEEYTAYSSHKDCPCCSKNNK
jgi:phage-related holin